MNGVEIRRAGPDELDEAAALYGRVLRETFTWAPAGRHTPADFLATAREEEVYLAHRTGRLLGFASFYRPANFLHSLFVEARGEGVGKALLDHVAAIADGPLSLKVEAPNTRALAFYRREGFRIVEELPGEPPSLLLSREA